MQIAKPDPVGTASEPRLHRRRDNVWIYFISVLPAVAIALLAPSDVVTRYPLIQAYTSVCRALIPAIDKLTAVSSFPEVTQLVLSITWSLVPLQTVLFLVNGTFSPKFELWRQRRFYAGFLMIVVTICMAFMVVLFDITPRDLEGNLLNEWVLRSVSTSRFWFGLITGLLVSGVALFTGMLLVFLRYFPFIYFNKWGRSQF